MASFLSCPTFNIFITRTIPIRKSESLCMSEPLNTFVLLSLTLI